MSCRKRISIQRVAAFGWLGLLAGTALLASWLPLPFSPDSVDLTQITQPPFLPPTTLNAPRHWLGTDGAGRDVLANLVFGARTTVLVSLPTAVAATLLGALGGSLAGFWGNTSLRIPLVYYLLSLLMLLGLGVSILFAPVLSWWHLVTMLVLLTGMGLGKQFIPHSLLQASWPIPIDRLLLGLIALLAAVPRLVLVLALAAVQDSSLMGVFLLLTFTYWPESAQLIRAEMLRVRALPYIEAARASGLSGGQILWRHALPNAWRTIRTAFPLSLSTLIGLETTLSFLGIGLPIEMSSWGHTLAAARLNPTAWWLIFFPALALATTTLALRQASIQKVSS